MRPRGGNGEADALGPAREFPSSAEDFIAKLGNVLANPRPDLDDRLMQFSFDLLTEGRCTRGEKLGDVRSKFPGLRVDDLEFFLDAHRKSVCHTGR